MAVSLLRSLKTMANTAKKKLDHTTSRVFFLPPGKSRRAPFRGLQSRGAGAAREVQRQLSGADPGGGSDSLRSGGGGELRGGGGGGGGGGGDLWPWVMPPFCG